MCDSTDGRVKNFSIILIGQLIRLSLGNHVGGGRDRGLGGSQNRLGLNNWGLRAHSVNSRNADMGKRRTNRLGDRNNTLNGRGRNKVRGHLCIIEI